MSLHRIQGLTIHPGFAYGPVKQLVERTNVAFLAIHSNQLEVLQRALSVSQKQILQEIEQLKNRYPESVLTIFESHLLMVSDPFLVDRAILNIQQGKNAYDAYQIAAKEVISLFQQLDNSYIRNRVVDIEDITDRVLSAIVDSEYAYELAFSEPHIVLMNKLKPSIIAQANRSQVIGVIAKEGTLDQHAATLLHNFDIPCVVVGRAFDKIKSTDYIFINKQDGSVYINPEISFVEEVLTPGGATNEL